MAVAALTVPELAVVLTRDEYKGPRALARYLLDLCGRLDVPVLADATWGTPAISSSST